MGGDSKYLGLWYVMPYVIGLMLFTAFPFVASFYLSFTDYNLLDSPEWVGTANYEKLFTRDRTFDKSLSVTLTYVFMTVPNQTGLRLVYRGGAELQVAGHQPVPHSLLHPLDLGRVRRDCGSVALHLCAIGPDQHDHRGPWRRAGELVWRP